MKEEKKEILHKSMTTGRKKVNISSGSHQKIARATSLKCTIF